MINASGCVYFPDASAPTPFACGESNGGLQPAYVGRPVGLNLTLSDPDGSPINVTVWWDVHLNDTVWPIRPEPTNVSAVQNFTVTPTGPNQPVNLSTNWTFQTVGRPVGGIYSGFGVFVNLTNANGYDPLPTFPGCTSLPWGNCYFEIAVVAGNEPPSLTGLQGSYTYKVVFPGWRVPDFEANVTIQDADDDPVVVTWDWGDGAVTVNRTPPAGAGVSVVVTHRYALHLNLTPWVYAFVLNVTVDDGVAGHNTTAAGSASIEYYVGLDAPPSPMILQPTGVERLVAGRNVTFVGILSDFEADAMIYYWDFGDGSNTSYSQLLVNGTVSTNHVYAREGNYSALLWATDGLDKRLCLGTDCSRTHWVNSTKDVRIEPNSPPTASLTIILNPARYGSPAAFAVTTYDPDGDSITVRWDFGDNATAFNQTTEGRIQNDILQEHVYTTWGDPAHDFTFEVTARIDDGQGHRLSRSTRIFIGSTNMPPSLTPTITFLNRTVHTNETFQLRLDVSDPDGDAVNLTVDFGDGSLIRFPHEFNTTLWLNHSYQAAGTHAINLTATDGMLYVFFDNTTGRPNSTAISHVVQMSILVDIAPREVIAGPEPWTWWDFATLSVVLGLPSAYLARSAYLRREERRAD